MNVTRIVTELPDTVTVPLDGLARYPLGPNTAYEYAPFGSEYAIVLPVVYSATFPIATAHELPDGNPVSVNVTLYTVSTNVTETVTGAPFTVTLPRGLSAVHAGSDERTVYPYVPFGSYTTSVVPVERVVVPRTVTDQLVPLGRFASRYVTA